MSVLLMMLMRVLSYVATATGGLYIANKLVTEPEILLKPVTLVAESAGKAAANTVQKTLSQATTALIPPPPQPVASGTTKADLPQPRAQDQVVDRLTNPWLWGTVGLAALFGTTAIRQTRGLSRDIGSGVRSSREAFKEDFGELQSDPDMGRGAGRR